MSERMHVTTHFLQMHSPPAGGALTTPAETKVVQAHNLSPSLYRDLYNGVGAPWLWYERSEIPDNEISQLIGDPAVTIYKLQHAGKTAGYTELRRQPIGEIQILYFGLLPSHIGKGLGRYFLDWTVREAFSMEIKRLWVHTCSLDHPRALTAYQQAGFASYRRESGWVSIPDTAIERQRT
jgi:GNAT superfamily N-acetyltransferase